MDLHASHLVRPITEGLKGLEQQEGEYLMAEF